MKRFISLSCAVLFLVCCIAVPANAADINNNTFFNVLDFASANSSGSNYVQVPSNGSFSYNWTQYSSVYYVELLVNIIGAVPSAVYFDTYDRDDLLTIDHISGDLYRIYGKCGYGSVYTSASIRFVSSGTSFVTVNGFNLLTVANNHILSEAYCEIASPVFDGTIHYVPTDEINYRIIDAAANFQNNYFFAYIWSDDWKEYDYLDFQLMFDCLNITSINAVMGSINVPIETTIYDSTSVDGNRYFVSMRMDLSGLDRSTSDYPMITVMGRLNTSVINSINFVGCSGFVLTDSIDPYIYWYQKIFSSVSSGFTNLGTWISNQTTSLLNSLSSLKDSISSFSDRVSQLFSDWFYTLHNWVIEQTTAIGKYFGDYFTYLHIWMNESTAALESAIRGDTDPGNDFSDEVDQKDQAFDDMAQVMDSVTKPDVQDINVSVDQYVKPADVQILAAPLTVFFEADLFRNMIIMSILLATVSFTLYGKR